MRNGALGTQHVCPGQWPCSRKGRRLCRKVREGVDPGSGMWVVRERVLFGECMDVLELGE